MDNSDLIQQRVKQYLKLKNLTHKQFEEMCNLGNGTAARLRESTRKNTLDRIANNSDLNILWLLTGEGEMLKENINVNADNGSAASAMGDATVTGPNNNELSPEVIELLKRKDAQIDSLLKEVSHLIDIISKSK